MEETTFEMLQRLFAANEDTGEALTAAYVIFEGGAPSQSGYVNLINTAISTNYGAGPGVVFNSENIFINIFNNLVTGNADAAAAFDGFVGAATSLSDQVSALYAQFVPAELQTAEGLAFMIRPEALAFYEGVAAERGMVGEDGPATVALASLIEILRDADVGIGAQINDLTDAIANGTATLPEDGTEFTPLSAGINADTNSDTTAGGGGGGGETGGGGGGGGDNNPPPDPEFSNSYGDLSDAAVFDDGDPENLDELYAGTGNPTDGMVLSVNTEAGIELALDARYRFPETPFVEPVEIDTETAKATYQLDADLGSSIRFAYSVASTDGTPLNLTAYDIKLFIDTDAGPGQEWVELLLQADTDGVETYAYNNANSVYDWGSVDTPGLPNGTPLIQDDGGSTSVSQNVQAFQWYNGGNAPEAGDIYSVRLAAYQVGTDVVMAQSDIEIQVVGTAGDTLPTDIGILV